MFPFHQHFRFLATFILHSFLSSLCYESGFALPIKRTPIPCDFCCPPLLNSRTGVVKVHEGSALLQTLSYIARCLLPGDETILISDGFLAHPISLLQRNLMEGEDGSNVCTQAENMPLSLLSLQTFLERKPGFFLNIIQTSRRLKRANFVIVPQTSSDMTSSILKVKEQLDLLRATGKLFWEPYVIFVWPDKQMVSKNVCNGNESRWSEVGQSLLSNWLESMKPKFSFDSSVFFLFIVQKGSSFRSSVNLFLSLWEIYSLKGEAVISRVQKSSYQNDVDDWDWYKSHDERLCDKFKRAEVLLAMEKINSYFFLERFARRGNFRLHPLKAIIKDSSDWTKIQRKDDGTIELVGGTSASVYNDMKLMLNYSDAVLLGERLLHSTTNYSSALSDTVPTDSIISDISLNQESMTYSRALMASFLQPTHYGTYQAFFQQPSASAIRNIISAPFTKTLWFTFIMTWLIIIGFVYIWWGCVTRWSLNFLISQDNTFVNEIGIWTVAAICQKSWHRSPSTLAFQTILCTGSLMAFVCYAAYSAMIVSFLTVKVVPVKSLYDLIDYGYKFTVHEKSEATTDLAKQLIHSLRLPQTVIKVSTEDEISHILRLNRAFLAFPDLFYITAANQNFTAEFICKNISKVNAQNVPFKSAMSVPKGSQYREVLNQKLSVIRETGLIHRYTKVYEDNQAISCMKHIYLDDEKAEPDPVRLPDVLIAFVGISIGWALAYLILFAEILKAKRRKYFYLLLLS